MSRRKPNGPVRSVRADGSWIALALLAIAVYLPSLGGEFLWDDNTSVTESEVVHDPGGWWKAWVAPPRSHPDYFPLTTTAFWLQWRLWGLNPAGYHWVSVLLHAGCVVLFHRLLRELKFPGAWAAAALVAVHPVNVESVAWIAEQKNLLCLIFALPAFQYFVRWHRDGAGRDYQISLGCHAAALAAKASVVGLPVLFAAYMIWRDGRFGRRSLRVLLPFIGLSVAFAGLVIHFQHERAVGEWQIVMPGLPGRIGGAALAFWFYLGKAVWPFPLATIYPQWNLQFQLAWPLGLAFLTIGGLGALWGLRAGRFRGLAFGLTGYGVLLGPTLGLVKMSFLRHAPVADHFQHLALPALVGTLVVSGFMVAGQWRAQTGRRAGALFLVGIGLWFGGLSWQRAALHGSHEALWRDALAKNPASPQPHQMLGTIAALRGENASAEIRFRRAIDLGSPEALINLGITLCNAGRFEEAIPWLQRGATAGVNPGQAYAQWARALVELNRTEEALGVLEEGATRYPGNLLINSAAGAAFVMARQPAKALGFLERCERLAPRDVGTKLSIAQALEALGRGREAAEKQAEARRIQ